jgi:Family of unknown function (DUF6152)
MEESMPVRTSARARLRIMPSLLALVIVFAWTTANGSGAPHHGTGGYDFAKTITLAGTATSFDWTNPHCLLHVDVKDNNGNVQRWTLEMAPPSFLARKGWAKDSIRPGDQVTIDAHPAKNGITLGISSSNSYILKAAVNGKLLPTR